MKKISHLLSDRMNEPLDTAIWWIEYMIRNGIEGAAHLKTPAISLKWYQYLCIDIILFIFSFLLLFYIVIKLFVINHVKFKTCQNLKQQTKYKKFK